MSKLVIQNDTPFTLTPSSRPQAGTSWYDLPAIIEIAPGAAVYVAGLTDTPRFDNWGWIYFFHNEDPSQEVQVYAECKAGEVYGMIGPQADGSGEGDPMPGGFAPAVPAGTYSVSSFVTLNYVYHGAETGLAGVGQPMDQVAMATFDDPAAGTTTLFLVGASPRGNDAPYLYAMSAVLPQSGSPQAALAKSSAWTRSQLALPKWQQVGDRSTPSALSAGSLAVQDVGLVYFWNEADYSDGKIGWRFLSTTYSHSPPSDPYWGSAVEMRDETGAPIGSDGFNCGQYAPTDQRFTPDVGVIAQDSSHVLAAMLLPDAPGGNASTLLLLQYDTEQIFLDVSVTPNVYAWPAVSAQRIPVNELVGWIGVHADDVGLGLSMDGYSTYPPGDPESGATPSNWLVLAMGSASGPQVGIVVLPVTAGIPAATVAAAAGWPASSFPVVQRDTAGRITIMYNTPNDSLSTDPESLNTVVLASNAEATPAALATVQRQCTATSNGKTPSVFWWMSSAGEPAVPVDAGQLPNTATAARYPVYRFMAYDYPADAAPVRCAVQLTGWGEQVTGVSGSPTPPTGKERIVLQGIVDGPVPIPGVNAAYMKTFTNMDTTYNSIIYGTQGEQGQEYTVTSSNGWGVRSQGGFTCGYGIAWDVSVDSSTSQGFTTQTTQTTDFNKNMPFQFSPDDGSVSAQGVALIDQMTIIGSRFQLLEPDPASLDGTGVLPAADAAPFIAFTISFSSDGGLRNFPCYTATPGDLWSYTRPAITAQMRNHGYTGEDYVRDVIEANAVAMTNGKDTTTATTMNISWGSSGMTGETVSWSQETFTEQGYTFNTDDFVGISGGFSADVEGPEISVGAISFDFTALAGLELSWTNQSTTSNAQGWQISLDGDGLPAYSIPAAPDQPHFCGGFDFTLYFLPASNQWTKELMATLPETGNTKDPNSFGQDSVVTGSQPWRICFVVTRINEYVDGTGWVDTYQDTTPNADADPGMS